MLASPRIDNFLLPTATIFFPYCKCIPECGLFLSVYRDVSIFQVRLDSIIKPQALSTYPTFPTTRYKY